MSESPDIYVATLPLPAALVRDAEAAGERHNADLPETADAEDREWLREWRKEREDTWPS